MLNKSFHWSFSKLTALWSDSLYRNSFWLMAGSYSMAGIGFFYWLIAARLYTPEQIGLATTFLSAASLINGFAMLGFGTTLIRYLPTSEVKERKINTSFTVVFLAAMFIGLIYLIGLPFWTQKLLFIRASIPALLIIFTFFPINTINGITDSVFTAFRKTHWVFVSNITQSLSKLIALALLSALGVWGVIGSNIIATVLAAIVSLILITSRFGIHFRPTIDRVILAKVKTFAVGNYLSGLIGNLPALLLPIIITNRISPQQTAYFYMPNMFAGLLLMVPSMISRSYFTENSQSKGRVSMKKPLLLSYSILLPSFLILVFFGRFILNLFGKNYASQGYNYLVLSSFSILISVVIYFLNTRLLLLHRLKDIVAISTTNTVAFLLFAWLLLGYGINGIGFAGILTQLLSLLVCSVFYVFAVKKNRNLELK